MGGGQIQSCDLSLVMCAASLPRPVRPGPAGAAGSARDAFDSLTRFVCHRAPHSNGQLCQMLLGGVGSGAGTALALLRLSMIALWSEKDQLPKRATIDLNALRSPLSSARGCVT